MNPAKRLYSGCMTFEEEATPEIMQRKDIASGSSEPKCIRSVPLISHVGKRQAVSKIFRNDEFAIPGTPRLANGGYSERVTATSNRIRVECITEPIHKYNLYK